MERDGMGVWVLEQVECDKCFDRLQRRHTIGEQ